MDVVERAGGRRAVAATDGLEIDTVKRLVHDIKRLKNVTPTRQPPLLPPAHAYAYRVHP